MANKALNFRNCITAGLLIGIFCLQASAAVKMMTNLQDPNFISFVKWMRAKNYSENIISRYAEDYMDPKFYPLMKPSLTVNPTSGIDFAKIHGVKFIDLLPIDTNAVADPTDFALVKEQMKSIFGINVNVTYYPLPISYLDRLGPATATPTMKKGTLATYAVIDSKVGVDYKKKHFLNDFNNKYPGIKIAPTDIVRFAISTLDGLPFLISAYNSSFVVFIGADKLETSYGNSIDTLAHEWSHSLGLGHDYSTNIAPFVSFGTHGTLSIPKNQNVNLAAYFPKFSPLQAYSREPAGGYDYPDLILGPAYSNYLLTLDPSETPYSLSPNPKVKITTSIPPLGREPTLLKATIQNTGNIPLALIPIKIISPIPGRPQDQSQTQSQTIDWLEPRSIKTIDIPLSGPGSQNVVSIHVDNTQCKIAEE